MRESYAIDCATLLSEKLNEDAAAIELLIEVGTERPTIRLAERVASLYERNGEYTSAYDWLLEAVEMAEGVELQALRVRAARMAFEYLHLSADAFAFLRSYARR